MFGPPGGRDEALDKLRVPKPKALREVPGFLKKVISGFFSRLFYIFCLVWETRPWILFYMTFHALFAGLSPVAGAYLGAWILNALGDAIAGNDVSWDRILGLIGLQAIYLLATGIEGTVNQTVTQLSGELVKNHIQLKIVEKSKTVDLASFDMPEFYEKLENASREAGARPINIISAVFNMISAIIGMVTFIVILSAINGWMPWLMILVAVPSSVITFVYRQKNFRYARRRSLERRQMNYYNDLLVNKDMVKEIRMYNLADMIVARFKAAFRKYFSGLRKIILGESAWNAGISLVRIGVNGGLFLYVARKVFEGVLKIGDYSLATGALNSVAAGVQTVIATTATVYEGTLFIDNMIAFMNEPQTVVPRLPSPLHVQRHVAHTVEFRDVCFHYPGVDRMVIDHLNLKIDAGQTVVLVGLNGAGKTTLIKLLTRLYDPTDGVILLDGQDIRDYDTSELYRMFGIIFQDFGKYAFTVEENISFGQIDRPLERDGIVSAARAADAEAFISRLPVGYETPLMRIFSRDGVELSGGQWQKLAVARAFYSDSDFLILDEPTASLDALAEQEIFDQFDELRRDKTTIFVSHRLSSATTADKIVVLEHGRVAEEGTHAQLMAIHGRYRELFSTQARRYVTEAEADPMMPRGPRPPKMGFPPPFPPHFDEKN